MYESSTIPSKAKLHSQVQPQLGALCHPPCGAWSFPQTSTELQRSVPWRNSSFRRWVLRHYIPPGHLPFPKPRPAEASPPNIQEFLKLELATLKKNRQQLDWEWAVLSLSPLAISTGYNSRLFCLKISLRWEETWQSDSQWCVLSAIFVYCSSSNRRKWEGRKAQGSQFLFQKK